MGRTLEERLRKGWSWRNYGVLVLILQRILPVSGAPALRLVEASCGNSVPGSLLVHGRVFTFSLAFPVLGHPGARGQQAWENSWEAALLPAPPLCLAHEASLEQNRMHSG